MKNTYRGETRVGLFVWILGLALALWAMPASADIELPTSLFLEEEIKTLSGVNPEPQHIDPDAHPSAYEAATALYGVDSRLSGTEGCDKAARYIVERFKQIGMDHVVEQPFEVVVPITRKCEVTLGDTPVSAYPMWPNWVQTSSTPGPVSGPVLYSPDGRPGGLKGLPIEGSIVVIEHNTGAKWQAIAQYGPRAILFVEPGEGKEALRRHAEMKILHDPVNIPRFWIPETRGSKEGHLRARDLVRRVQAAQERYLAAKERGEQDADLLLRATVDSHVVWETRTARNIVGFLEGTEGTLDQGHFQAFSAFYDSMSIAPDISPGADPNSSMASLLRLADHLSNNRLREGVMFVAFAGHYQALAGATWFADALGWSNTLTRDGARHETDTLRRNIEKLAARPLFREELEQEAESLGRQVAGLSGIDSGLRNRMMAEVQALLDGSSKLPSSGDVEQGDRLSDIYEAAIQEIDFDPREHFDRLYELLASDPLSERLRELVEREINVERRLSRYEGLADLIRDADGLEHELRQLMLAEIEMLKQRLLTSPSSHSNYANLFDLIDMVPFGAMRPRTRRNLRFSIEREQDFDRHNSMHRHEFLRLQQHQAFLEELGVDLNKRLRIMYSLEFSTGSDRFGLFTTGAIQEHQRGISFESVYGDLLQQIWEMGRTRPPVRVAGEERGVYERIIYPLRQPDRLEGVGNSYFVGDIGYDGEMIQRAGREAVAVATVDAARARVDTPTDTFDAIDRGDGIQRLTYQADLLCDVVSGMEQRPQIRSQYRAMDDRRLSGDSLLRDYSIRVYGQVVLYDLRESVATADIPQPHALCAVRYFPRPQVALIPNAGPQSFAGIRVGWFTIADEGGRFELLNIPHNTTRGWGRGGFRFEAFRFHDPDAPALDLIAELGDEAAYVYGQGEITHAPDMGPQGAEILPIQDTPSTAYNEISIPIFKCRAVSVMGFFDPLEGGTFTDITVWDARTNTTPDFYGLSLAPRRDRIHRGVPTAVVYVKPDTRFKLMFRGGLLGNRLPLLNIRDDHRAEDADAQGIGFEIPEYGLLPRTRFLMTRDVTYLNDHRIRALAEHGVHNERVNELHAGIRDETGEIVRPGALQSLEQARRSGDELDYDRHFVESERALAREARAYPIVRGTTTDILTGVLFYLFLLLPFSYFVERLLFGFPSVNKRIAGFFGVFLVVFIVIAMVHPAFAITRSAPMILIAFIALALALLVIMMIRSRFELEVRRLHERPGSRQSADFKRMSATGAACALGIGNMRRRRTRTLLTLATLVLLTFSVLSFTSVDPQQITHENPNPTGRIFAPPYPGVLLRDPRYQPISDYLYELSRAEFSDKAKVVPRAWLGTDALLQSAGTEEFHHEFLCAGVAGMVPHEPSLAGVNDFLSAGRWFRDDDEEPVIILGSRVARHLNIDPARITGEVNDDTPRIRMHAKNIPVVGLLNDQVVADLKGVDGEEITPVDWRQESWMRRAGQELNPYTVDTYQHVDPANSVFLPFDFIRDQGASIISVSIVPREYWTYLELRDGAPAVDERSPELSEAMRSAREEADVLAEEIGDELLSRLTTPIYVSSRDRVTYKLSSDADRVGGFGAMLVPMLICAMIVLNTMLGSVYERQREIGIFGSLGLAPLHIGSLFVAEAAVFGTVAVILGYVLGQTTSFFLVQYELLEGFSLNYSSTSAVISAAAVMALVLLSAVYPARKASQMSVPDVDRIWKLPEPEGDHLHIKFPFTIGGEQAYGVNMFLMEYFRDHANQSVGDFFAQDSELTLEKTDGQDSMKFESQVWIAPFDFGISQSLVLYTVPTEEKDIFAPEMHLHRKSGSPASWGRMNHKFLKLIRQQFLMWRILSSEERHVFAAQAKVHLGIATAEERRTVEDAMRVRRVSEEGEDAGTATADEDNKESRGEEK